VNKLEVLNDIVNVSRSSKVISENILELMFIVAIFILAINIRVDTQIDKIIRDLDIISRDEIIEIGV